MTDVQVGEVLQHRFFEAIAEVSGSLIVVIDKHGHIRYFSRACQSLTGYTPDEVTLRPFWEFLLAPVEVEAVRAGFHNLRAGLFPNQFENAWISKTGEARVISWLNTALLDDAGEVEYIIGTGIDVTEQRSAEEESHTRGELLRTVVSNLQAIIFSIDRDGIFTLHEGHALEAVGLHSGQFVGRSIYELFGETRPDSVAAFKRSLQGEEVHLRTTYDGRPMETHLGPLRNDVGEVVAVTGVTVDMSEQQRMVEALQRSESWSHQLMQQAAEGIFVHDEEGRIVEVNPRSCAVLGYTREELLQMKVSDVDAGRVWADMPALWNSEGKEGVLNVSTYLRRRDGQTFPVEMRLGRVQVDGESLVIGHARDITEQRRLRQELEDAKNELELRVQERTQELQNSLHALETARRTADEANRAKSEFLSRMSHELRTPLNAILGFAQLLQRSSNDAQQEKWVAQVLKAGQHLLVLVDEVLEINRIETQHLLLTPQPVDAQQIFQETVEMVRPLAAPHDITLHIVPPTSPLWVQADPQRLKQVLINLLSNAIKYNRQGGSVTLTASRLNAKQGQLDVCDTGSGIDPHDISRLFTPFERLGAETRDIPGTGLGLAVSKALVGAMSGEIQAQSTLGCGSMFSLVLPLAIPPSGAMTTQSTTGGL